MLARRYSISPSGGKARDTRALQSRPAHLGHRHSSYISFEQLLFVEYDNEDGKNTNHLLSKHSEVRNTRWRTGEVLRKRIKRDKKSFSIFPISIVNTLASLCIFGLKTYK